MVKLLSETETSIPNTVVKVLESWIVIDQAFGMAFDTTTSYTRRSKWICVPFEKLERDPLHLACHHLILALVVQASPELY